MKKLRHDKRGAVTIIVTLMLIPALLLSGTAVDLSRIYAARSVAQNANQLVGNAVLTQYDALLQDLYGLFGVAEDDPILGDMIDEYIQLTIFGEAKDDKWIDTGLGSFQTFNGSTASAEILPAKKFNLENTDVLRRQIEEYMKFRGPVILVESLLNSLETQGSSIKASSEAIEQQKKVDAGMGEYFKLYGELYEAIQNADKCNAAAAQPDLYSSLQEVWKYVDKINHGAFGEALKRYKEWEDTPQIPEKEKLDAADRYYLELMDISKTASKLLVNIEAAISTSETFKTNFERLVVAAQNVDSKREETREEIDALEQKINDNNCDDTLKGELAEQIRICRELLDKYPNIENMAKAYQEKGDSYIETVKNTLGKVRDAKLRYPNEAEVNTIEFLEMLWSDFKENGFELNEDVKAVNSKVQTFPGIYDPRFFFENPKSIMPDGFEKFAAISSDNTKLYNELKEIANSSASFNPEMIPGIDEGEDNKKDDDPDERQRNIIEQLKDMAEAVKKGLFNYPEGSKLIEDSSVKNGNLGSININADMMLDLISNPGETIQEMADFALILTYDTSMFSNYTTTKPQNSDDTIKFVDTTTGVPMSPNINYFYQSEWEYLLVGNKDADENLDAVKELIYTIRLVCNTISSFSIPSVKAFGEAIQSTCTAAIPFAGAAIGAVLKFAAHVAFAAAESAVDLIYLRNGHKVLLMKKTESDWKCGFGGVVDLLEELESGVYNTSKNIDKDGLTYEQYLLIFFLLTSDADMLTERTGNLIEWNVINYLSGANADNMDEKTVVTSEAMAVMSAEFAKSDCFRLAKRHTDFDITTTIDLRLLFLTMPLFKKQGAKFSNELEIAETDYRGY